MVEQIRAKELTAEVQEQDCGCGCGGGECGNTQQELLLLDSAQVAQIRQKAAVNTCGCGCDGSCGCWSE